MNGCEYCIGNERQALLGSNVSLSKGNQKIGFSYYLFMSDKKLLLKFSTDMNAMDDSVIINYCPMCGHKLGSDNNGN